MVNIININMFGLFLAVIKHRINLELSSGCREPGCRFLFKYGDVNEEETLRREANVFWLTPKSGILTSSFYTTVHYKVKQY